MDIIDVKYIQKCKFVVASGIFDGYDIPHQPSNISRRSQKLFCFLMVVDEVSLDFIQKNTTVKIDSAGGKWVGIWRLLTVHRLPFDEPRRNGKIPKILTHRLFPQAWYSIWIDGKMELIVDPLLILERLAFYLEPLDTVAVVLYRWSGMEILFAGTSGVENTHSRWLSTSIIGASTRRATRSSDGSATPALWLIFR